MSFNLLKGGGIVNSIFWMLLLFLPLFSWLESGGNILDYFVFDMPKGQFLYVMSKLVGLFAFVFLWLHISYALLRNSVLSRFILNWSLSQHRKMAVLSLALIATHLLLFVLAVSLRKEVLAFELFIPNFFHGSYKTLLSLGVIAFWLILFVALMGRLKRIWLHRLSFVCFALIYFHGLGVGSETKSGVLYIFYQFLGISFIIFLILRFIDFFAPRLNQIYRDGI